MIASPIKKPRRRLRWCAALGALLAFYFFAPLPLQWIGAWLDVGERLNAPVDYVYVLGGEANTRPFLAAAIYRAGYTNTVLIPEGNPLIAGEEETTLSEHELQYAVLRKSGVPAEAIRLLTGPVDSTRDEAQSLAEFLKSSPQANVAIVTSDFHTRRARLVFRRHLSQHRGQIRFAACATDGFSSKDWWHYRDGILWYTGEYAKLVREHFR